MNHCTICQKRTDELIELDETLVCVECKPAAVWKSSRIHEVHIAALFEQYDISDVTHTFQPSPLSATTAEEILQLTEDHA